MINKIEVFLINLCIFLQVCELKFGTKECHNSLLNYTLLLSRLIFRADQLLVFTLACEEKPRSNISRQVHMYHYVTQKDNVTGFR